MRGNPFQRLVSRASSSSAVSRLARAPSGDAATQDSKMPQSQPMQRSTQAQRLDSEYDRTPSSPSDDELVFESASTAPCSSSSSLPSRTPLGDLHSPLKPTDPALLRVAEILTESIVEFEDDWCFTPSPEEPYLSCYDFSNEHEVTVLAVHSLVKRASLPVDTFILAALILRRLKPSFYDDWCELLSSHECTRYEGRCKEIVIMAAIVIAQKFLHDAIYTLTTWSDIVCEARNDLHNSNLHATERLILAHISWRVSMIADEETISTWVTNAHEEASAAYHRYHKYLQCTSEFEYGDDGDYTYGGGNTPNGI